MRSDKLNKVCELCTEQAIKEAIVPYQENHSNIEEK